MGYGVTYSSPNGSPDTGKKKVEAKRLAGRRNQSQVLRVKEDEKNISDTKEPFLQANIKNSIKSISP